MEHEKSGDSYPCIHDRNITQVSDGLPESVSQCSVLTRRVMILTIHCSICLSVLRFQYSSFKFKLFCFFALMALPRFDYQVLICKD